MGFSCQAQCLSWRHSVFLVCGRGESAAVIVGTSSDLPPSGDVALNVRATLAHGVPDRDKSLPLKVEQGALTGSGSFR